MTGDVLKRESRYEAVMYQVKRMLSVGLISEQEFQEIEARFRAKHKPISGGYIVQTDLLCARRRVMNGCGKEAGSHEEINVLEPKQPVLAPRKRVAAYARVSMETERLKHSLSAQISYYSALIQKNPEWIYAGVYADDAISGTGTEKRGEFNRLIADCDVGRIDIVLVKSISRFARNTVDLLNTVRHLKNIGVEVWFEDEGIHSMDGDGELMLTILASFAQEESRSISENCKWGIRKQYERGAFSQRKETGLNRTWLGKGKPRHLTVRGFPRNHDNGSLSPITQAKERFPPGPLPRKPQKESRF